MYLPFLLESDGQLFIGFLLKKVPIFMPFLIIDVKFEKGLQTGKFFVFNRPTRCSHDTVLSNHIYSTKLYRVGQL